MAQAMLEEVIVTAQKREQSLQDVPVAVTAFTGKMLQDSGIRDVFDLQVTAPGLVVDANQSATTSNFAIRGLGTGSQNFGLESSVGLYVDGVYRARQSAAINDLVDIESVEVLRGPQGTLFGRNTPAGAILFNTVMPDHEGSGFAEITAGNYGLININGAMSFSAIDDVLAFRATGFSTQRDGWVDDISLGEKEAINDRDRYGIRLQGLYTPNDDLSVRVIADYSEIDEICCATTVVVDNNERDLRRPEFHPYPLGSDSIIEPNGGTFIPDSRVFDDVTAYNQLPVSQNEDQGISVQVDWHHDNYTLTSISAWREFTTWDDIDIDFTDLDMLSNTYDGEQSSFTQELRIAGETNSLNYVAGLYYFTQDLDSVQVISVGEHTSAMASVNQGFPVPDAWFPADGFVTTANQQEHESWAAFGQFDYQLSEAWTLTAGLRYTEEEKELEAQYTETNAGFGFSFFPPLAPREDIPNAEESGKIDDDDVTGALKISWFPSNDILLYASYSTGYKSGGTNTDRVPEDFDQTFGPETSESYEVGMKAEFPEQALRVNVALQVTDVDDLQVNTFNGTGFNLRNAGTVEAYGGEVEVFWQATDNLFVTASYARTVADYGEFEKGNCWTATPFRGTPDPGGDGTLSPDYCVRDGDRIGTNPEDFFVLTARQEFSVSDTTTGFVMGEYTYTGDMMMESSNDPFEYQGSYDLINLRLGIVFEKYDSEITLWGRNVTDEDYYGTNFDGTLQDGRLNGYAKPPRTYGITARTFF